MKTSEVIEAANKFSKPYRVTNGKKFRLKDVDPVTRRLKSEDKPSQRGVQNGVKALAELQDMLTRRIAGQCCSSSRRWMRREGWRQSST